MFDVAKEDEKGDYKMSGIPTYFYNEERVYNLRFFKIDKVVFAEFQIGEELFVDKASALTTVRPEVGRVEKVEVPEAPEVTIPEPDNPPVSPEPEPEPIPEEEEEPVVETPADPEPTEPEVTTPEEGTEGTETQRVVMATNLSSNDTIELIDNDELELFADENQLDTEAVERVISGEQKTHKGFSFEVTN